MKDIAGAIASALRRRARGGRLRVGVFYRGRLAALDAVLSDGHETIVAGDSFRALFKAASRTGGAGRRSRVLVEARYGALPFRPGSLDALVLTDGLPRTADLTGALAALRPFLAPGGVLVFPHPVTDGRRGPLSRLLRAPFLGTLAPLSRSALCENAMAAGYCEIGQEVPKGRGLVPWIVTVGASGRRGGDA